MGKKQLLATFLYSSGILQWIAKLSPAAITVLGYHRIRDDAAQGAESPFDEEVFGPTQSQFERQLKWLKQNFTLLSESELLTILEQPNLRDRYAVLTFDDGYRDNYELALPVLRAHGAPAIFFVCPGLIDSGTVGWWDLIAYLIKRSAKRTICLDGSVFDLEHGKSEAIAQLTGWMKRRPHRETADLVARISEACAVALPDSRQQSRELMTWEEVREAKRQGIAIGSHTHTHRVLATLREEDERWELRESKSRLESQLHCGVRTIAYPAGNRSNFTARTKRLVAECGYSAGFSYHSGVNTAGKVDRFDIARIAPANDLGPMFGCGAMMPNVFTWVHTPEEPVRSGGL